MTFDEYLDTVFSDIDSCPSEWRTGQCLFNHLVDARPDVANQIRSTDADPFYDDTRIVAFLSAARRAWDAG